MEVSTMSFISDNWKVNQFRTMNVSEKVQAFVILSFEMIFALAAFFTFSGVQVCYDTVSFFTVSSCPLGLSLCHFINGWLLQI
jgi:hypothetical protein